MKRIDFKEFMSDLEKEGITMELLTQVQNSGKFSPAIMYPDATPVTLIRANGDAFWVQNIDGTFEKEGKKFRTYDLQTCIIARARYWLLFSDQEEEKDKERKEKAIQREVVAEMDKIKRRLIEKVKDIKQRYESITAWAYNADNRMEIAILTNINPEEAKEKREAAKEWMKQHPEAGRYVEQISQELEEGDFDSLYIRFETDGVPLLFQTRYDDPAGMEVVKRLFSKDKLDNTLERIAGKSHLESVAIMAVEKRYA